MSESDGATLARMGTDADKWATEFLKRNPTYDITHEALLGWFANAIGAGESLGYVRGIHEHADVAASVRELTKR
jgi:hypothetical protein